MSDREAGAHRICYGLFTESAAERKGKPWAYHVMSFEKRSVRKNIQEMEPSPSHAATLVSQLLTMLASGGSTHGDAVPGEASGGPR